MEIAAVAKQVLARIKPSPGEEQQLRSFLRELVSVAKTVSGLDAAIVGSTGKGTWLRGDHDIDLFLMFPRTASRSELEERGLAYGRRVAKALRGRTAIKYAEHPYVRVMAKGYNIDVVPCYRIGRGEKVISAVDRSPLHLEYVLENIAGREDEARLLKQFCKGASVYGSDAKTEGFSGYICELLVMRYGSFESAVRGAAQWKAPHKIPEQNAPAGGPLVIADPVDRERNAAAVVSAENFVRFVNACRAFVKKPSAGFFFPRGAKPLSAAEAASLRERGTKLIALHFARPDVIDDTLYPQMRRTLRRLEAVLEAEGFHVLHTLCHANSHMIMMMELEVWKLPSAKKMVGPPVYAHKHVEEFMSKYRKALRYIDGDRVAADVVRKQREAASLVRGFFSGDMRERGIASHIAKASRSMKLLEDAPVFRLLRKDALLAESVRRKYFEGI